MSADQSRLRTTLLGSLLDVGRRNRSRGAAALRLFEAGAVYLPGAGGSQALPSEPYHVAVLLSGAVRPATWRDAEPRTADFFAAKGVLAGMLDTVHVPWTVEADSEAAPFLHPGRAARIVIGGVPAGWIGEIHPQVAAGWDWGDPVAAFEVNLDVAAEHVRFTAYQDLTSFPEIREDLAVIVADTVTAAQVLDVVRGRGRRAARRGRGLRRLSRRAADRRRQRVAGPAPALPRPRPHPHRRGGGRPGGARSPRR